MATVPSFPIWLVRGMLDLRLGFDSSDSSTTKDSRCIQFHSSQSV